MCDFAEMKMVKQEKHLSLSWPSIHTCSGYIRYG